MSRLRFHRLMLTAVLLALACAVPARALASSNLESSLMDDQQLLYDSPTRAMADLTQIAALGINQIKVSLVWSLVAPNPTSAHRPNFSASNPDAYPSGAWARYDRLVLDAQKLGLRVYLMVAPPAPAWAVPKANTTQSERLGHAPDTKDFQQFVQAAGTRYDGHHDGLPRVSMWGIWNEPNFPAWLNPLHRKLSSGKEEYVQPLLYRGLVNAAWKGLKASGHTPASDTILIGELANSGSLTPTSFVLGLYCVSSSMRPLTGLAAQQFGCPTSGSRSSFVNANPGLFGASGFAHHPYAFNVAPNRPYPLKAWFTLYNLGSLERLLNGAFSAYGKGRGGGVPLYLTEFGYESNPPNPYVKNSTTQQATWLNEAEYMAWKLPYVQMLNQFELIDSRPRAGTTPGSRAYWSTYQMGLEFVGGKPKPALNAFRLPIWLPTARHGGSVTVWGQLRPTNHSAAQTATIQYESQGSSTWTSTQGDHISTTNGQGFFLAHVPIPSAGLVRLAWTDPKSGQTSYSRTASVS